MFRLWEEVERGNRNQRCLQNLWRGLGACFRDLPLWGVKAVLSHSQKEQVIALEKDINTLRWSYGHRVSVRPRSLWLPASLCDCCQVSVCYLYYSAHHSSSPAARDSVFLATQMETFKDMIMWKYFVGVWERFFFFFSKVFLHIMVQLWVKLVC